MNKPSQIRHSIKSLGKHSSQKNFSLHHLYTLNSKLQNEQVEKKNFLQKIKQQRLISRKIGQLVNQQIGKVQNDGTFFATKIQQERRKNKMLMALVKHYQQLIYKDRIQNNEQYLKMKKTSSEFTKIDKRFNSYQKLGNYEKQNGEKNQKYEQQNKRLKQLEKDLQQLILRSNASQYQLSKKLDQVRALRSDRIVFNKIFDQFQNQLFTHQFEYKKLLIQKSVLENHFCQKVEQYQFIYQKSQKQCEKLILAHKKRLESQRIQFLRQQATKRSLGAQVNANQLSQYIKNDEFSLVCLKKKLSSSNQFNKSFKLSQNRFTYAQGININKKKQQNQSYRYSYEGDNLQKNQNPNGQSDLLEKKVSFKLNNSNFINHSNKPSHLRAFSSLNRQKNEKSLEQQNNILYQKKVKDILLDLKVQKIQELTQIANIQEQVDRLYKQAERLYQKIYNQQKLLQKTYKFFRKGGKNSLFLQGHINSENNYGISFDAEESKKMENFITHRQQFHQNINKIIQVKKTIHNQLNNFWMKQITKLMKVMQISQIVKSLKIISQNKEIAQNSTQYLVPQQQIHQIMCKLDQFFNKAVSTELIKKLTVKQIHQSNLSKQQNQIIKTGQQKSFINQNINFKLNQTLINSHRQRQSSFILSSLTNTQLNYKDQQVKLKNSQFNSNKSKFGGEKLNLSYEDQYDQSRLEQILKANRVTHNNTTIYSQQELIQISKLNLSKNKMKKQVNNNKRKIHLAKQNQMKSSQVNRYQFEKSPQMQNSKILNKICLQKKQQL